MPWIKWITLSFALIVLSGCASTNGPNDPIEGVNRGVYGFNEGLDTYAIEPASRGWTAITSSGIRQRVGNFYTNLQAPGFILNDTLQGKPIEAGRGTVRFVLNTTVGLLGFFDPAEAWFGFESQREDFGQTLGVWGAESGSYLVVPLFGPSSVRDVTQYPVAHFTNVMTYITLDTLSFGLLTAVNVVNSRAQADGMARFRDQSAVDPYVFTRSAYRQYRQRQILDGEPATDEDPYADYFEELEAMDTANPEAETN